MAKALTLSRIELKTNRIRSLQDSANFLECTTLRHLVAEALVPGDDDVLDGGREGGHQLPVVQDSGVGALQSFMKRKVSRAPLNSEGGNSPPPKK